MSTDKKKKSDFFERLKKVKHIEIILSLMFVGVLLVVYFAGGAGINIFSSKPNNSTSTSADTYAERMEQRLQALLGQIKGVDYAEVMINFESTPELIIAYIENESVKAGVDASGNFVEDKTSNKNPVIITQSGGQLALVLKEVAPSITGVMIVAKGAEDVKVRLDILNAVSVLLNIDQNKIAVLTGD